MKIEQPEKDYFTLGTEAHRIIQKHISGKERRDDLKHINFTFPIVEEVDFDPNCKFTMSGTKIDPSLKNYDIIGFIDGLDPESKRFLEIKTAGQVSGLWSLGKYKQHIQRKIYALALDGYTEALLVTAVRDVEQWSERTVKTRLVKLTDKDREEARKWIMDGIKILESGEFTTDLVDGVCTDNWCWWGENCFFKAH